MSQVGKIIVTVLMEAAATTGPIPRSTIYMLTGMDMHTATVVETVMVDNGWIKTTSETIRITDKGRQLVESAESEATAS